ncbi:MAG: PEP-CTERM/exosortase system-associated acyltransferase [Desulfuromonadaceae bacterium]
MTQFKFLRIEQHHPLLKDVLSLRYQVYCHERGFEPPENHPGGLERDDFDQSAVHFAAVSAQTGQVVGTVRLITHSQLGFPIEHAFEFNRDLSHLKRDQLGEISRLALSKEYCRTFKGRQRWQSEAGLIIDGLFRCLAQESCRQGLTHLYAVMSRGLPILLARKKILFSQIGLEKEYHGMRSPYVGAVRDILNKNPELVLGEKSLEWSSAVA